MKNTNNNNNKVLITTIVIIAHFFGGTPNIRLQQVTPQVVEEVLNLTSFHIPGWGVGSSEKQSMFFSLLIDMWFPNMGVPPMRCSLTKTIQIWKPPYIDRVVTWNTKHIIHSDLWTSPGEMAMEQVSTRNPDMPTSKCLPHAAKLFFNPIFVA